MEAILRACLTVIVLGVVCATPGNVDGLRCHQCTGVTDPHFCSLVAHCNPGEECYTEKVIGEDNIIFYNTGCKKTQLCELASKGRRTSELHVCEGCCGTDLCNSELCPVNNSTEPGVQCYQCDDVDDPLNCTNRVTCADGEQCIVQKYANDDLEVRYSLGCETKQRCDILQAFGRRSTQMCNKCCDTPGCNRHLCAEDQTPRKPCQDEPDLDCIMANNTHDICERRTLAAIEYCPKFCGFCTDGSGTTVKPPSVTEDPCQDSGDLDCQQMNDTLSLCANKNSPPVLLYCPKYCGVCTPRCTDSPDVDCQLENSTHNICALHTLTATKYCQKFCGYCNADGSPVTTLTPPTGITEDPCKDTGDVDCQTMNDTLGICNDKTSPPTVMYCPKYCGICQPACYDLPDVDCRKENATNNICALQTLTAKNYCQKFCGLCGGPGVTTIAPPGGTTQDPCSDSGDVDCAAMDQAMQICSKPNDPPTQMYCPKYCHLC